LLSPESNDLTGTGPASGHNQLKKGGGLEWSARTCI